MIVFCFRILFLFAFIRCIFSLSIIEHTLDQTMSYKDCFIDPTVDEESDNYLSYCLRTDNILKESWPNECYKGKQVTFTELRTAKIKADDLLPWHIPLDIADIYGSFLSNNLSDDRVQFICNCTVSNTFGRYCEYSFKEEISTIEELIQSSVEEKEKFYPKERLLPCYEFETEEKQCLDYRDICDGEFDTINGEDEFYCDLIETNICDDNQFRCRNGLCIDRQFLFDGQDDCTDLTDEQSLLIIKKYNNFQNCYKQATMDCDEHWCGREMISCGDGECIPWFKRFWNDYDCQNSYTHVYNCELEERSNKSINFSITDNNGRCTTNITELNATDDQCLLMIKCAVTLHPSCKSLNMSFDNYKEAITHAYDLCQNRTVINYASGVKFFSPFVDAYYTLPQLKLKVEVDFFALMKVRVPNLLCLTGEHVCKGITVIQNGSTCIDYDDIYEKNYPFPPYEYLFCQSINHSTNYCMNTTFFYRCRTSGECISKFRLFDGFADCIDLSDENHLEGLDSLDPLFMKDRYNCTIDGTKSTAIMRHFLGDGISQCMNGTDEMSLSINWQQQQCLKSNDLSCLLLRNLYNRTKEEQPMQILRFTSLCDSLWDLRNGSDEIDCHEWVCEPGWIKQSSNLSRWSGNCINPLWQCNQIWDYTDGSDEFNCSYTEKYPIPDCLLLETDEIIPLNESNLVAGNGYIDCSGGIDERVTFACNDGFPLNERFLCNDKTKCLEPMYLCNFVKDCSEGEDESTFWCGSKHSLNSSICQQKRFACQERNDSGPCIPQEDRCHDQRESCIHSHLDDHMCIQPRSYTRIKSEQVSPTQMQHPQLNSIPPWYCDRGLVVHRYGKLACLCPPSFFGHRCEKHSHRVTVIFTVNRGATIIDLIRIHVLLINHHKVIDHILLTHEPSYKGKHRLYLNYPRSLYSDLRKASNNYSVQLKLYTIKNDTIRLLSVSQYHIKYSFLPAFRLVVTLPYKEDSSVNRRSHQFHVNELGCHNNQNSTICPCAQGSTSSVFENQHVTCICTSRQYGLTCHLTTTPCPLNFCHNQSTCISYVDKFYTNKSRCLCSTDYFGNRCENKKALLSLDLHDGTILSSAVRIIQLINYDMTKMQFIIEQQHLMSKNIENIFYNDVQLPSIGLLKVYELLSLNIYLLYFGQNYSNIHLTGQNRTKCMHANELNLIPPSYSYDDLLMIMKRYHQPCRQLEQKNRTVCFYDPDIYFCFCNETTHRSSCFLYDFKSDQCNECLNRGRCIKNDSPRKSDFSCVCPPCYHGHLCEISTEPFGFTLDSLIVKDSLSLQIMYLCLATFFFLVGLGTNVCSIVTFKRPTPRTFGVGNYFFVAAVLNQTSLFFFVVKILTILLGSMHIAHVFSCKSIAYLLSVTTRANYWLTTWTTIERLSIILFPTLTFLSNPKNSIIIVIITLLLVCGMHFHEAMSYTIIDESSLCIPVFRSSTISIYNQTNIIFHHLIPFLVQVIMITLLIVLAARSRTKSFGRKVAFRKILRKQFHTHRELYLTPAIIVLMLSILPQGILSFSAACIELKQWQRYILLGTYFFSYLPQMLGFILQVLPSSGYTTEFKETSLGKLRFFKWMLASRQQPKKQKDVFNMSVIAADPSLLEEE